MSLTAKFYLKDKSKVLIFLSLETLIPIVFQNIRIK